MPAQISLRLFSNINSFLIKGLSRNLPKRKLCSEVAKKDVEKKYNYLLVLDFEATCDKKKIEQEIIEFPCLKINIDTMKEEATFHHYVKPVKNPHLTVFCTELTGIMQETVDNEKVFPDVFRLFEEWREAEGLTDDNSLYVTSGDWDLGHMLPIQCEMYNIPVPKHMMEWIDIKKLYANNYNYCGSLIDIIKAFGLEFQGRLHSGIDDCKNILNVLRKLKAMNISLVPTSKLEYTEKGRRVYLYGGKKNSLPISSIKGAQDVR
ncbi:hypothetical protein RUM44_000871 [Polyplax serrata]|uniref:Exonuclease domain-containing protein n=1 Tax=Polyplax serrata TaxID=468196 RepID=A0ABR1B6B1_POLSC